MEFSKLSYSQVQSLADSLHNSAASMETLLSEIKALFENIGNDEVWSGTAAAQTKEQFDLLSAKFPEFYNAVDECHKYLLSVVANYQSVDAAVNGQI